MQKNFILKAKNTIKRIAAISASSVMLGASMTGLAAADLGDYPSPFIGTDGALSGLIVVGADAASADVVGATELVSTLAQAGVTAATGTGTTTTVTGGKKKDVNIGHDLTTDFGTTGLDDGDLAGFIDTTIDFNDSTYNIHDVLLFGANNVNLSTSLSASDDDYGSEVALELKKGGLQYYYVVDEKISFTNANTNVPATINFLGKSLKITTVSAGDHNTMTAQVGQEYFLGIGDSVTVLGKVVTLNDVSSSSTCTISVDVDGVSEVVSTTSESVNGIKIEADECFYSDTKAERSASVIIGEFTSKTYNDADAFIGQDEDDPDWKWDLGNLNDTDSTGGTNCTWGTANGPCIGIINDFVTDDWDDNPIQAGESYCLPYDYACVKFDALDTDDYTDITIEVDKSIDLDSADVGSLTFGTSEDAIVIASSVSDTLILDQSAFDDTKSTFTSDVSTNTIYLVNNTAYGTNINTTTGNATSNVFVFYLDKNNDPQYAGNITMDGDTSGEFAWIDYKDTTGTTDIEIRAYVFNATAANQMVLEFQDENADTPGDYDILMNWTTSSGLFTHLGVTASTEEAGEIRYGDTNIGTKDEDHRTHYGIVIYDPKSNGASDKVKLSIPGDDLEATIVVTGTGTTTASSATGVTVVSVAGTDVAKLDTEVTTPSAQNLILVGGPAVNRLTAQVLGLSYPTYGTASTIPENKGLIKLVSNAFGGTNTALVVAGWEAGNTRDAADILKKYKDYSAQLSGQNAVEVVGTTVTAVGSSASVE